MKKLLLITALITIASLTTIAQKVEVLYFKANLGCCAAKACAKTEGEIKEIIEGLYNSDKVEFKAVLISDEKNADLVIKHNAKSQTVVIVKKKKKNETIVDISDLIRNYSRNNDKAELESKLKENIDKLL